jgi:hypothetical protein
LRLKDESWGAERGQAGGLEDPSDRAAAHPGEDENLEAVLRAERLEPFPGAEVETGEAVLRREAAEGCESWLGPLRRDREGDPPGEEEADRQEAVVGADVGDPARGQRRLRDGRQAWR